MFRVYILRVLILIAVTLSEMMQNVFIYSFNAMIWVIMLRVIILTAIVLSVVMLGVVTFSVSVLC